MTFQKFLADVVTDLPYAVAAAAAAMAVLPPGKPGSTWATLRAFIDMLAMNWGHAKNAPPKQ